MGTEILQVKTVDLKPYENNARYHSPDQIKLVENSIKEFGFTNPILIDENNNIIAGHGRLSAALDLGMVEVPCIVLRGLNDTEVAAYRLADNKIALNSDWNFDLLKIEFEGLIDSDYDIALTGFDNDEIRTVLGEIEDIESLLDDIDNGETDTTIRVTCKPLDAVDVTNTILRAIEESGIDGVNIK